jgi:hypothetical protein
MMSTDELLKEISSAQVTAGEAAVIASLESKGLGARWALLIDFGAENSYQNRLVEAPGMGEAQAGLVLLKAAIAQSAATLLPEARMIRSKLNKPEHKEQSTGFLRKLAKAALELDL